MKNDKDYRSTRRRFKSLRGTRLGPWLEALLCVGLLGGGLFAFIYWGVPAAKKLQEEPLNLSCLGFATPSPSPSPSPTPAPSPTPVPGSDRALYSQDLAKAQHEIVIGEYQYAADFSVWGDTVLFSAGNYSADGTASLVRAIAYDTTTNEAHYYPLPLSYKSIRFAAMNDRWLAYFDAQGAGGGCIRSYNRATGESSILKTVHTGLPVLALWEDTVFWIERTGTSRDKLFGCDLNTGESVTIAVFDGGQAGISRCGAGGGKLVWAGDDGLLNIMELSTGEITAVNTKTVVHDPKTDGSIVAFLTGYHGEDSNLCYLNEAGAIVTVAEGVEDFSIGDGFIAYGMLDKCYVYFPDDSATFCITRSGEESQFLGAGGDLVLWMDVTWRDKDIIEYMHVQDFS